MQPPANALMPVGPLGQRDYGMTPAEGLAANVGAAGDFISQQRARSAQMGLYDPGTGLPTQAGLARAAGQYGNTLLMSVKGPNALAPSATLPGAVHPLTGIAQAVRNYMTRPNYARAASPDAMAAVTDAINTHPEIAHAVRTGDWTIAGDTEQPQ
jgi:hypothetical protein